MVFSRPKDGQQIDATRVRESAKKDDRQSTLSSHQRHADKQTDIQTHTHREELSHTNGSNSEEKAKHGYHSKYLTMTHHQHDGAPMPYQDTQKCSLPERERERERESVCVCD